MNKMKMGKLGTFNLPYTDEDLRGTVFYSKRATLTQKQLSDKPLYRTFKLLEKISANNGVEDYEEFYDWACKPFSEYDRTLKPVKSFIKRYGDFEARRYLLSVKNAVDLYIVTGGK